MYPSIVETVCNDILIIKKGQVVNLTHHRNKDVATGSIKFIYEEEKEGNYRIFLDTLIVRKDYGTVKLLIYRKSTHTDQYL